MANKILLKNLKVIDPNSPYNRKRLDVFIEDGIIKQVGKDLNKRAESISFGAASILPGFCDLYADFCDPGFEHRESLETGIKAAIRGGFTTVCTIPATQPVVQSKSSIDYIMNKANGSGVDVLPLGALSEDIKGIQPTEMYDMQKSGAVGFTDAPHAVKSSGSLLRSLQYVQPFNGIVFDLSTDESLASQGHLNEGEHSVRMGLKGISHMAEVVHIKRNIEILRYAGGRLHIYGITTKEGVDLIKVAKKEGLDITASVFVHHLIYTDDDVKTYDSNYKINPPFRLKKDREALKKGLLEGTIDCICTQHTPIEIEGKKLEFEYANNGLIGLETAYSEILKAFEGQNIENEMAQWLSLNPRTILNKQVPIIDLKQQANFTIVNHKEEWNYEQSVSKSNNSPLIGSTLKGKIKATFNHGKLMINE